MRLNRGWEQSGICYFILKLFNIPSVCKICQKDNCTCGSNNYMLHFEGAGKYNNKYMCLECLRKKIENN